MGNARIKGWTTRSCNQGQKPASKSGKLSAANAWADCSSIIIDKPPDFEVALPKQPLNRYVGAEWASLFAATLPRVPKPVGRDLRRQTSRSPVRPLFSSAAEYFYQTGSSPLFGNVLSSEVNAGAAGAPAWEAGELHNGMWFFCFMLRLS